MCVRYVGTDPRKERIAERLRQFEIDFVIDESAGRDTFQRYRNQFVSPGENGRLHTVESQWGIIPFWAKPGPNGGKPQAHVNARSEGSNGQGIENMPTFRKAFAERRCIMLAETFYEQEPGRWLKVTPKNDHLFVIAAIWEEPNQWTNGLPTCAFVTTEPNAEMAEVHDRMPVVLDPSSIGDWLAPEAPLALLKSLMQPCPAGWVHIEDGGPRSRKRQTETGALL